MATQSGKTSLQQALQGRAPKKGETKLKEDLEGLFQTLSDKELAEAIIERVQRYVIEALGKKIDDDFSKMYEHQIQEIQEGIRDQLKQHISSFISDAHREFIVRCHAKGLSTSDAVPQLIRTDETIGRLAQNDAMGVKGLTEILIHRLSYLKPSSTRWSEKKYGAVWHEAREEYKQALQDIPLASQEEQVALLAKHASAIDRIFDALENMDAKQFQVLSNSLVKTVGSLQKMTTVDEQPIPVRLSAPQLVAVLERLTLALKDPKQQVLSHNTAEELVGVLEQLTLALKMPAQQTNGNEAKVLTGEHLDS